MLNEKSESTQIIILKKSSNEIQFLKVNLIQRSKVNQIKKNVLSLNGNRDTLYSF